MQENKSPVNIVLVGLLIVAAFVIGTLWQKTQKAENKADTMAVNDQAAQEPTAPVEIIVKPVDSNDHIRGNADAPITWIEYSDLECPYCKKIHPDLVRLMDEYDGKVRWVYRHFPLDQLHSKARKEAEASECVASLGGEDAFWIFIDKIYEVTPANNGLDLSKLPDYAAEAGVDKIKFQTCLDNGEFSDAVQADYESGVAAGVRGTPGGIVIGPNGQQQTIPGALPYDQLKQVVESMLAS